MLKMCREYWCILVSKCIATGLLLESGVVLKVEILRKCLCSSPALCGGAHNFNLYIGLYY